MDKPFFEKVMRSLRGVFSVGITVGRASRLNIFRVRLHRGSRITVGTNSLVQGKLISDRPNARFEIGDRTFIGASLLVAAEKISIGDDVLISWDVTIIDHQSHSLSFFDRKNDVSLWALGKKDWSNVAIEPVFIEDKVWIGFGVAILPGVRIGEGAVVGACSVVTKNIPPWSLAVGNPARVIRAIDDDKISTASAGLARS